jgi:glyoxylase-like metal-dependent hydrolase (beta-lactamase superfamily II)
MELFKVSDKIWVYVFEDNIVITALVNNHRAVLIDAGFDEHAKKVKENLATEKIIVETIIFTHYHPDHVVGSNAFEDVKLMCNCKYKHNYEFFLKNYGNELKLKKPTDIFEDSEFMTLNEFNLKFLDAPGHSECSSIIVIDDETINVGDLVMQGLNDKPALPCVNYDGSVRGHIRSLELIIELEPNTLIMGHRRPLQGKGLIQDEVNKRLSYLNKIIATNGDAKLEECLGEDKDNWELHQAHESNIAMYKEKG